MSVSSHKLVLGLLLVLVSIAVTLVLVLSNRKPPIPVEYTSLSDKVGQGLAAKFAALQARERQVAETVWAREILAQKCGQVFDSLWDSLNAATNKLSLVASFPIGEIVLGKWSQSQMLPHGIELREPSGPGPALSSNEWRRFVEESERAGWQVVQTEFRHTRFETDDAGRPRQSQFDFSAHLVNSPRLVLTRPAGTLSSSEGERDGVRGSSGVSSSKRVILEGDLIVDWAAKAAGAERAAVKRIDASRLTLKTRLGEPPFRLILNESITPPEKAFPIDPLILYDLDGDGLSEIILPAKNLVYRRRGEDRYQAEPLCKHTPGLIFAGIIADVDGDGVADLLCAKVEGLVLLKGSPQGSFDEPERPAWLARLPLMNAMVLTCGDIDRDGDLDMFLGQYKVPTYGQHLKPRYYDANDGYPAYLLLNDGQGQFTDATAAAGLEKKRRRRTYSASFVDLNEDGHLDLLVVSDFAGVDLYRNDGQGQFTDMTGDWVAEPHAFGMAHALADFNADGGLDFLMIGMNSPTVDRLDHLNLWRPDAAEDRTMRSRMTFGNRLYLARTNGGFEETRFSESIARSGWSWGCSAPDFDNDGFPDVYIANGHQSKQTVRDYEPEFWLHDIYVDDSIDDVTASAYFTHKFGRTLGQGWSYGGYEKNRFYLNRRGASFVEVGHLLGVALEADSRNVAADDLDGDGRVDLLVTTYEVWPEAKQTLRVYENALDDVGNWIGFRFREEEKSPVGVRVTLRCDGRSAVRQIVTGDSYRAQHANTVHFGLGQADRVDRVEIRWPDGRNVTLRDPAVDQYHLMRAPHD